MATDEPEVIAAEVLAASDSRRQIPSFGVRLPDLDAAYAVTAAVRRARIARGMRPLGRKIGFTNKTIWSRYGVYAPIWSDMYDTTLGALENNAGTLALAPLLEPRIEPEIAFCFEVPPQSGMSEWEILDCVRWVAHGCEIVQSVFPRWQFTAPDTVAAYGLHGAYRLGERHEIAPADRSRWFDVLHRFEIDLLRNGEVVERGRAANVLDGPLSTIVHLLAVLAADRVNPPLQAGEIVTTGTLTDAYPVFAGEHWETRPIGLPVAGLSLRFI